MGNGVIIGPPGVGKTYLLKKLSTSLIENNKPCLYLPIDKLGVETEAALKAELGIRGDFIAYLRSQKVADDKNVGIVVIDAFDAARSDIAQKFYLSLIQRIKNELRGLWNIIVSVRTYDARKSEDLLDIFPSSPDDSPENKFLIPGIHCRHFGVPMLSKDEIKEAFKDIPPLQPIYERASMDFKELLVIPFNLWLLEKLLAINPNMPELSSISSEVQLLGLFWKQRVTDGPTGDDKRGFLSKVTQAMVAQRSLSVRKDEVNVIEGSGLWDSLLSAEILFNVSTTAQRVVFSHNILFDYAVSVLLIEDDPVKCVEFITKDLSRPLFLHPSLNYYFTRLWHSTPDLFWKAFWHILPKTDIHLRLFARLLPTSVLVNEGRKLEQLTPLLDSLKQATSIANIAMLRLLQALRALQIERNELWIHFLDKAVEYLHRDFAWDFAVVTSDIFDKTKENAELKQACGSISRHLLKWIWKERGETRDAWLDNLGANWAVPLVAKTFNTEPQESRLLLEKVLSLIREDNFPIKFLYQLTDNIENIWPYDAEFVALIYLTVFSHNETSQEKTHMGGIVMSLTSTRYQDYHMCQYKLIQDFPIFLRTAPVLATMAIIECLNNFIIADHILGYLKEGVELKDLTEKFQFRGKTSHYLPDSSFIWDEMEYNDEPIKMANELYMFITELASSEARLSELDTLLDVFIANVKVAFFWRRLLETAARNPKVFAQRLYELSIAQPIQMGEETVRELGVFLEAATSEFSEEQQLQVEKSIMSIPASDSKIDREYMEHRRNRLLARIPAGLLKTEHAIKIREEMEKSNKIPSNEPVAKFSMESKPYTTEDWLKEQGADLEQPENQELQRYFPSLDKFKSEWQNKIPTPDANQSLLKIAKEVYDAINRNKSADNAVLNSALTKLASCMETMSRGTTDPESDEFQFCREVLLFCSKHELPKPDPEYDSKYNSPHWSPAPRNEAAQGLPWLAIRKADAEILKAIKQLVHDRVPSVRFLVTMELWRLMSKAPDVFWDLAHDVAEYETNRVVQNALCHTLSQVIAAHVDKSVRILEKFAMRVLSHNNDSELLDSFVYLLMWLVLVQENAWATKTADILLLEPIRFCKSLKRATFDALTYITPLKLDFSEEREIAKRAIDWLAKAIDASEKGIKQLRSIPTENWNEETYSKLREVYGVIDEITMRLYFAADVRNKQNSGAKEQTGETQRKNFYFEVKVLLEKVLVFALDKENGIMFASTAHHFMELLNGVLKYDPKGVLHMAAGVAESSKPYGYYLDSLAVGEVVKLVEAILADYRSEVRDGESLEDLLNLLDIFAEAGWPDTLRLVWRLDEVFR
ncbi:MAG: ATP-binding protein [Thermodesulfovibrionales bacterium]